ncbi:MAG: hypothetical protein JWN46_1929 [Acidimicrobiales bacterium]|nr:hypothetical protein [Acidimicrobiales bacterium]
MTGTVLPVVWYRFRTTFRRRRRGYVAIIGLIAVVGGSAMASVAAARRTQSTFPAFLARTNRSDLVISVYGVNATSVGGFNTVANLNASIRRLPAVRSVEHVVGLNAARLTPGGAPRFDLGSTAGTFGSVDGLYFDHDRPAVAAGRMADPTRPEEFVTSAEGARQLGLHLGQVVPFGFYGNGQQGLPGFGTSRVPPLRRLEARLVGLVVFNNEVVQDDVDRSATAVVFGPALTRPLLAAGGIGAGGATYYGVQLAHGARDVPAVEHAFTALLPPGAGFTFHDGAPVEAKVERAIKPQDIALGLFGAIAGAATLVIATQAITRQLRAGDAELDVLRALGAGPATTMGDGLLGLLGALSLGALAAAGVAVALSPLAPIGPVRRVDATPGVVADWAVVGIGVALLVGALSAAAIALAYRGAPHRVARRSRRTPVRRSSAVRVAATAGLPTSAVVGVGLALEPGRGQSAAPVRSALLANLLAVVTLAATLTFASGLHTLVSRPALYGWNWDYALNASNDVPPQALALLRHDPRVAAWTGMQTLIIEIDSQSVPVLLGDLRPVPGPPILSGHTVEANDQVVLGPATLAQLHKHVGDRVLVSYGSPSDAPLYLPPTPVRIVGTATMPAIGQPLVAQDHTSMGIGALASQGIQPAAAIAASQTGPPTLNGPNLVFVRLRAGGGAAAGRADMQRIVGAANRALASIPNGGGVGFSVDVLAAQRPAEIVNYRTMGATPAVLSAGLAAGAIVSLALTLAASVRRRRRDLAILKTLGFTRRQLAASVAWHASIVAVIGVGLGVPVGIALGRQLWTLFARTIDAVPAPTVPVVPLVLLAVSALALANLAAALPGRAAARIPTALLLHAE